MQIVINGEKRDVDDGLNLADMVERLKLSSERVAIELNFNVIRKKDWTHTKLTDGDKLEVIHFVGGG